MQGMVEQIQSLINTVQQQQAVIAQLQAQVAQPKGAGKGFDSTRLAASQV